MVELKEATMNEILEELSNRSRDEFIRSKYAQVVETRKLRDEGILNS